MNLLDIFRKKEKRKKLEGHVLGSATASKASAPKIAEKNAELPEKILEESTRASVVLESPKISEKSSVLSEKGVYVFRVSPRASKNEIKKSVEELYKVKVEKINVINVPSRLRSFGRKVGRKPGFRKAMVKLNAGEKIEYI